MTKATGYKNPPDATKWKKGESGNPSGRKMGNRNFATDLADELAAVVELQEAGRTVRITKQQALVKTLIARSIKGEPRAVAQLLKVIAQVGLDQSADLAPPTVDAEDEAIIAAFLARNTKGTPEA